MTTSFDIGFLLPAEVSKNALSTGSYSLSPRSNVPYVALRGAGGFLKKFTWGDLVDVPPHMMCYVSNESGHGGDVFINSGCDDNSRPSRITVPVPMEAVVTPEGAFWRTFYPADCRGARRAYFMPAADIGAGGGTCYVLGKQSDGSHNTQNQYTAAYLPSEPGTGYQEEFLLPALSTVGAIPLGARSQYGDDTRPHCLLTTAWVYISQGDFNWVDNRRNAYFVMEY